VADLEQELGNLIESTGQAAVGCLWPDPASAERTKSLPHPDAAVEHAFELPLQWELLHLRSRSISFPHDSPARPFLDWSSLPLPHSSAVTVMDDYAANCPSPSNIR
jgi:hypothetical protein